MIVDLNYRHHYKIKIYSGRGSRDELKQQPYPNSENLLKQLSNNDELKLTVLERSS